MEMLIKLIKQKKMDQLRIHFFFEQNFKILVAVF
jgi:hypothetical protein